jgi:sugar lactone lactonase YvrE
MNGFRRILFAVWAALLMIASACGQPATVAPPTAQPPTALPPTAAPTLVPTTAPTATAAATEAPTAVPSTPTATADAGVLATQFFMTWPYGVAVDAGGTLYISTCPDDREPQILTVDPAGVLKVYAGSGWGFAGDGGPALKANFACLGGIALGPDGSLYMADQGNNRIRRIDQSGVVSTVAGSGPGGSGQPARGSFAGDGGPATEAMLWAPTDVAVDQQGNLYIADHYNNRVRKVDAQGVITTIAGTGEAGFSGDGGPATAAQLSTRSNRAFGIPPDTGMSIAVDAEGNVYISDSGNARIRKVNPDGIISTIAGTGEAGFSGDGGPATAAQIAYPSGLAVSSDGSVYFSDGSTLKVTSNRIRKIDPDGIITTVAGTGSVGFSGDGGPATAATLSNPTGITFDAQGNLYFADDGNERVRKIGTDGIITTVAGGGF